MKKREKKEKKKLKKWVKFFLLLLLLILLCVVVENVIVVNNIKKSFNKTMIVKNDAILYEKSGIRYKKVGIVYKKSVLNFEKRAIKSSHDAYFKIKNLNYYVYYKDVSKTGKTVLNDKFNYLKYGLTITTKKGYTIYHNGLKLYKINKNDKYEVLLNDDTSYGVLFNNMLVKIDKKSVLKTKKHEYKDALESLGTLYYDMSNKDLCISNDAFKEQVKWLKDNGYKFISTSDYTLWKEGKVRLDKASVLLMTNGALTYDEVNINKDDGSINVMYSIDLSNKDSKTLMAYKMTNTRSINDIQNYLYQKIDNGAQKIAVLNYHFFFDPKKDTNCNEVICEPIDQFKQQLDYLANNGFTVITMDDFKAWMYGEKEMPLKSVLITVDDGAFGTDTYLPQILKEYKMQGTLFLIAAWHDKTKYKSDYVYLQSHGYNLHVQGNCGNVMALCLNKTDLVTDLKKSIDLVDTGVSMAYPFYKYNTNVIESVKEAGFKLAFAGGGMKDTRNSNKYAIPRYPIERDISMKEFKSYVD